MQSTPTRTAWGRTSLRGLRDKPGQCAVGFCMEVGMGLFESEEWRKVEDWPYEVSDFGRVRRVGGGKGTRLGKPMVPFHNPNDYERVTLHVDGRRSHVSVHSLVTAAFLGACPEGKERNHKDGDKRNNALSNLEYLTRSENLAHAYRIGLLCTKGERNGASKLTESEVLEIRASTGKHRDIAMRYGICRSTVGMIKQRKLWSHLAAGEGEG